MHLHESITIIQYILAALLRSGKTKNEKSVLEMRVATSNYKRKLAGARRVTCFFNSVYITYKNSENGSHPIFKILSNPPVQIFRMVFKVVIFFFKVQKPVGIFLTLLGSRILYPVPLVRLDRLSSSYKGTGSSLIFSRTRIIASHNP